MQYSHSHSHSDGCGSEGKAGWPMYRWSAIQIPASPVHMSKSGQDTEPVIAPDEQIRALHGFLCLLCMNVLVNG